MIGYFNINGLFGRWRENKILKIELKKKVKGKKKLNFYLHKLTFLSLFFYFFLQLNTSSFVFSLFLSCFLSSRYNVRVRSLFFMYSSSTVVSTFTISYFIKIIEFCTKIIYIYSHNYYVRNLLKDWAPSPF